MVQDQEKSKAVQVSKLQGQVGDMRKAKKALQVELQVNFSFATPTPVL